MDEERDDGDEGREVEEEGHGGGVVVVIVVPCKKCLYVNMSVKKRWKTDRGGVEVN